MALFAVNTGCRDQEVCNLKIVIDMACFPGSSGSLVILINDGTGYRNKTNNAIQFGGTRIILMGVLFAGPLMTAEGKIKIKEIPMINEPISKTNLTIHLGYIIKAEEILNLGEHLKAITKTFDQSTGNYTGITQTAKSSFASKLLNCKFIDL